MQKGEDLPLAVLGDNEMVLWRQIHAEIDLITQKTVLQVNEAGDKAYRRRLQYAGRAVKTPPCALGLHKLPDSGQTTTSRPIKV